VAIELGDLETAEIHNRRALELQAGLDNPRSRLWPRLNAARIAVARSRHSEAEALYREVIASDSKGPSQYLDATAGLGRLALRTGQVARADVLLGKTIEIIEEKRSELIREESKISYLARLMDFYRDYVDFLMERGEVEQALVVAETSRARVLSEKLEQRFGTRLEVDPLILKRIAGRREAVLLSYWLAPKRSFLWVVTPGKIRGFTLPEERVITKAAESYRRFLNQHRDPLESDHPAGRRLYEMVIAPVQPLLERGSRVVVVPDKALHGINLETLPVPGERPRYWIEEVTLAVAPSISTLG
ncbi:MAG: CHAT domain-containing protein, partial [bacterium]|nr:CHAT domain-containing protein [bacterium]